MECGHVFRKRMPKDTLVYATIPFNEHAVPIVNILDVTPEQLKGQWNLIPDMCKLDKSNGHAVGCS